mgnify:FL=1|tara:strand:+ start:1328 stop:2011 length:684 start_codon:yes stop_codon:yes gene_type:complete
MLSLKQSLSLNTIRPLGGWQPSDEGGRLVAWYKNKTGISLNGLDVSRWNDSSEYSNHMVQNVASKQPLYNSGAIRFVAADVQSLQTTGTDIELSSTFTVGIRLFATLNNVIVLGDNTINNEFFKITSSTQLRFKTDGSSVDITVNDGDLTADNYLVITRNASNLVTLYVNGVAQTDTETLAGTANIDAIGVRNPENNPYEGTISEIQIFNAESTELTTNVNSYLSVI